jgi:hypothetical protein
MSEAIPPLPLYLFMACTRHTLYLLLLALRFTFVVSSVTQEEYSSNA